MAFSQRAIGISLSNGNTDLSEQRDLFVAETPPRQRRTSFPEELLGGTNQSNIVEELREIKEILKEVKAKQGEMGKAIAKINKHLAEKSFDLSKSSHATNVTKILAKAYIQLGRFSKTNASKTNQLQQEFINSPYGLSIEELMAMSASIERSKFTYWRAEERRRVLAVGSWSGLLDASTRELSAKICSLLGVKYNAQLEKLVLQQTALVRTYITSEGIEKCRKDDHFWLHFSAWKDEQYGERGPSQMDWNIILGEQEAQ